MPRHQNDGHLIWTPSILQRSLINCKYLILLVAGEGFEPSTFGL